MRRPRPRPRAAESSGSESSEPRAGNADEKSREGLRTRRRLAAVAMAFTTLLRCPDVVRIMLWFVPDDRVLLVWTTTSREAAEALRGERLEIVVLYLRFERQLADLEQERVQEISWELWCEAEEDMAQADRDYVNTTWACIYGGDSG